MEFKEYPSEINTLLQKLNQNWFQRVELLLLQDPPITFFESDKIAFSLSLSENAILFLTVDPVATYELLTSIVGCDYQLIAKKIISHHDEKQFTIWLCEIFQNEIHEITFIWCANIQGQTSYPKKNRLDEIKKLSSVFPYSKIKFVKPIEISAIKPAIYKKFSKKKNYESNLFSDHSLTKIIFDTKLEEESNIFFLPIYQQKISNIENKWLLTQNCEVTYPYYDKYFN